MRRTSNRYVTFVGVAALGIPVLLASRIVHADVLPGPVMPQQVSKSLSPQQSVIPPKAKPAYVIGAATSTPALSPEAQKISFQLNEIIFTGNHVYSTSQLLPLYQDKLHKKITIGDFYKIVEDVTNFYRNNGYILSFATIPPQHSVNGVVKIEIVEGYVKNMYVTGKPRGAKCLVGGIGRRIKNKSPVNLSDVDHYILLANEIPNTTVKAVFAPSESGLGAADLNLETYSKPVSAYFSYDNYGTRYIGPQQMTGNVALYSAINSGDKTQVTFTKTPKGGELTFADINYNGPVSDNGARWQLGGTRVHTHPLFVLRPTQTDGLNSNIYTSISYPYIRTRTKSLDLTAGFNYLDSESTILDTQLYTDHLRSIDLGTVYSFSDNYSGSNMATFNFRQGLPIWGYSSNTNQNTATTSRPGGYAAYSKVGAQFSRLQGIKGALSLLGVIKGQWAFEALLSSEQYTFGGNPIGRGYDPAELIGDKGASGSLELRYDMNMNYVISSLQLYTFYDIGAIWNILVNATSPAKVSASSIGLGTRFTMTRYLSGNLMWAQPLTKQVATEELIGQGWRPRVFFSIVATFD